MNFFILPIFYYFINLSVSFDPVEQFELFFLTLFSDIDTEVLILFGNILFLFILFYNLGKLNVIGYFMNKLFNFYKLLFFSFFTKKKYQIYFYPFFFIFLFILSSNIIGLLPYTYTLTSLFLLTFFLAFVTIGSIMVIYFEQRRWKLFTHFFPVGVPSLIGFLLIVLELISYIVRLFSLSLRLFANMLSGHLLLKILLSFFWIGITVSPLSSIFIINIFIWLLIIVIFLLELVIAFLQAYVFTFLSLIYLREALDIQ